MRFLNELLKSLLWMSVTVAFLCAGAAHAGGNLVTKSSKYSVHETIDRIEKAVTEKGMKIFARIDHSGEAKNVGLDMKPTVLLIFGNPKGGTALMVGMACSCFFAAASDLNVPRFRRLPVFGFFFREYNRYPPDASFLIICSPQRSLVSWPGFYSNPSLVRASGTCGCGRSNFSSHSSQSRATRFQSCRCVSMICCASGEGMSVFLPRMKRS